MRVSAKADYALRALLQLAGRHPRPMTMREIVTVEALPRRFAETILLDLRRAGLVRVSRSGRPAYSLAYPPEQTTVGSVLRAVDGPLARVRGLLPEQVTYTGAAHGLAPLWLLAASNLANLLDSVTLHDLVSAPLPTETTARAELRSVNWGLP